MALILVIESDRRLTSKLTILARGQLRADLLIVENVPQALEKLDECDPDLILTSPMISGRDHLALGERLLELEEDGLRIQTLTIPPLGLAGQRARVPQKGAPVRGPVPRGRLSQTDAVDPVVFGVQISTLLDRIAAERAASGTVVRRRDAAVIDVAEEPEVIEDAPVSEPPPSTQTARSSSPSDWNELLDAMRREIEVAQSPARSPADESESPLNLDEFARIIDGASYLPGKADRESRDAAQSESNTRAPSESAAPAVNRETPEPAPAPAASAPARKKKVRRVPPQDEFGFFDPQQCGLSALFAKLDTISPPGKAVPPKKAS